MSVPKSANHLPPPKPSAPEPGDPKKKPGLIARLLDLIRNLSA